jgi:hypothetical protein
MKIFWIAKMKLARMRMRWISFRLRRRTGIDLMGQHDRAQAASERAEARALLIDPDDRDGAKRAGDQAFANSLFLEPTAKKQGDKK